MDGCPRILKDKCCQGACDQPDTHAGNLNLSVARTRRYEHGYDLAGLIDDRSRGAISFHAASLYPTLYRMEDKDLIEGRWVEKAGQRRRRYYRLTKAGRKMLASQRTVWDNFFDALNRVARIRHA